MFVVFRALLRVRYSTVRLYSALALVRQGVK